MNDDDLRYQSLEKCLKLARFLANHAERPTIEDMAAHVRVTKRTVSRYLLALARAGWSIPPFDPSARPTSGPKRT